MQEDPKKARFKTRAQLYQRILNIKSNTSPEHLCRNCPPLFAQFLRAVRQLKFEEQPRYDEYIDGFDQLAR